MHAYCQNVTVKVCDCYENQIYYLKLGFLAAWRRDSNQSMRTARSVFSRCSDDRATSRGRWYRVALDLAQFWDDICTTMYHSIDTALNYYTYNYVAMSLIPTFSEPFAISNVGVI